MVDKNFQSHRLQFTRVSTARGQLPSIYVKELVQFFTGKCSKEPEEQLKEARRASELMGLRDLAYILTNMITGEGYLNKDVEMHFHDRRCQRLLDMFVGTGKLAGNYLHCLLENVKPADQNLNCKESATHRNSTQLFKPQ